MSITYSSPRITITGGNDTGTATSGTTSTLTNSSKSWTTNAYAGRAVWIHTGTGAGQVRRIASNTTTVLTVAHNFTTAPDNTSQYVVLYNLADIKAANDAGSWGVMTVTGHQVKIAADLVFGDGSTKSGFFDFAKDLWIDIPSSLYDTSVLETKASSIVCFGEEDVNGNPLNGCRLYVDMGDSVGSNGSSVFGTFNSGGETRFFDNLITVIPQTWAGASSFLFIRAYDKAIWYGNTFSKHTGARFYSTSSVLRDNRVHDGTVQAFSLGGTPNEASGFVFYREEKAFKVFSTFGGELLAAEFKNNTYDIYLDSATAPMSATLTLTDCTHEGSGLVADAKVYAPGANSITGGLKEKKRVRLIIRNSSDTAIQSVRIYLKNTAGTEIINTTTDSSGTHTITSVEVTNRTGYPLVKTSYNPFEFRYRLYGYVFSSESATINTPLIDVIKRLSANSFVVASNAAATAYTGVTINGSAKTITLSGARTVQEMYDYSQAWGDDSGNIQYDECLTTADGSTFSLATGWKLVTSGSYLDFGGKRIAGGTLKLTATGTYAPIIGTTTIEFAAAGTYLLSDIDATGTVTFTNTSGGAVTVELPAGVTYVNSGPSITVNEPQTYQTVTVSGATAGSRLQIYDLTSTTELYNGTPTFPYTWTDSAAVAADREIRVRIAYVNGTSAKSFIEQTIGTCGTTASTKDVTYLASQADDAVYNANAVDGSTVPGVTFTDSTTDKMNIDISAGSVELADLYAAWVYYASTEAGIRTDIDYIEAKDTSNYIYSNLIWKNTTSPSVPLKISGGYAWDSVTEDPIDLVDTTGGTIFLAPPHVVSKTITLSGESVVTGTAAEIIAAIPSTTANAAAVLAAAQVTPIHSDMRKTVGTTLKGDGTEADKFRSVLVD